MALSCKVGTFVEKTSTGTQAYTGVGFQPKALILFGDGSQTSDGSSADARMHLGFGTAAAEEFSVGIYAQDALASSTTGRRVETAAILNVYASSGGNRSLADLSSLDADGFTLNYTAAAGLARLHHYLALGGDDLTNAKAGNFTSSGSTGNQAVTGIGFQPDCVILLAAFATGTTAVLGIGVMTADGQWTTSMSDRHGQATTDNRRRQRTDKCITAMFGSDTPSHEASFVSMDADGFTINWNPASEQVVGYLALKGGQFTAGSISQKTSTGAQGYTGVGFQPVGLLVASFCDPASTSTQPNARLSLGAASGPTSRGASWCGSSDNVPDSIADSVCSQTVCLTMQTEGTPTENARADLQSFDSDGFTLDWEVADATAREVLYLAFGSNAGGGGGDDPKPWLYRSHTQTLGAGFGRGL